MATNTTHHPTNRGHVSAMPRITEADATTVYATDARGSVCQRCIRCKTWHPIWSASGDTKIRIGKIVRAPNPHFGKPMANGVPDTREMLMFPKTKVGHGCGACADEYNALAIRYAKAREPFIKVDVL